MRGTGPRPIVYALFCLSGCAGLVYELVWTREMIFVLGGTTYAITTVLVAFMAGLALGSYVAGRLAHRLRQPGPVYGMLEIAIGLYVLMVPLLLGVAEPLYRALYAHVADIPWVLTGVRFWVGSLVLLVPTSLMGATLPVLVRFVTLGGLAFGRSVGWLYGINTFGAMLGTLLAGFYLIQTFGLARTTLLAAGINLTIGVTAVILLRRPTEPAAATKAAPPQARDLMDPIPMSASLRRAVLFGFGASGFAAMVYQIAWTRALIMSLGSSTYAFTCILAPFILGLALGSLLIACWIDRLERPIEVLAIFELGIALSAILIVPIHGRVPVWVGQIVDVHHQNYTALLGLEFLLVMLITLVPTLFMGAIFPLATRILVTRQDEAGSAVGRAYVVNTLGTILGSFLAGFVMIRSDVLGIQDSIVAAALLNALVGAWLLIHSRPAGAGIARRAMCAGLGLLIVPSVAGITGKWNRDLMLSAPYLHRGAMNEDQKTLFFAEGVDATVSVTQIGPPEDHAMILKVNGKPDASTGSDDMINQLLLAHLGSLLCEDGKSACVIGLGSGMTLCAVTRYASFERIDCVEISDEVIDAAAYFSPYTYDVLTYDPRVHLIRADGRNHLLLTDQTYDVIISEPTNPWISGVANLFTREFFQLCKSRLSDDGVMCAWSQSYSTSLADFQMVARTFLDVFDSVSIWQSTCSDHVLVARCSPSPVHLDDIAKRFQQPPVREDLYRIGLSDLGRLMGQFVVSGDRLREWTASAPVHTDDNALLEFHAARSLYRDEEFRILRAMIDLQQSPFDGYVLASADDELQQRVQDRAAASAGVRPYILAGMEYMRHKQGVMALQSLLQAYRLDPGNVHVFGLLTLCRDLLRGRAPRFSESDEVQSLFAEIDRLRVPIMAPITGASLAQISAELREKAAQATQQGRSDLARDYTEEAQGLPSPQSAALGR